MNRGLAATHRAVREGGGAGLSVPSACPFSYFLSLSHFSPTQPCGGAIPLCMVDEFDIPPEIIDRKVRERRGVGDGGAFPPIPSRARPRAAAGVGSAPTVERIRVSACSTPRACARRLSSAILPGGGSSFGYALSLRVIQRRSHAQWRT